MNNQYTAIISVDFDGGGNLMEWSETAEQHQIDDQYSIGLLQDIDFRKPVGVYTAKLTGFYCGGSLCIGYPCAGDCYETDWSIIETLWTR